MDTIEVAEDLFRASADGVDLLGSRCTGCGTYYFPKSLSCRNPACDVKTVEDAAFGRHATLYSFTVQRYRPPALFRMEPWEPYLLGLVELPEGLRVMAMLTGLELDEARIGMPLVLTTERLLVDESGRDVITYKYAPGEQ